MILLEIGAVILLVVIGSIFYYNRAAPLFTVTTMFALFGALWYFDIFNVFAWGWVGVATGGLAFIGIGAIYALLFLWPEYLRENKSRLQGILRDWENPEYAHRRRGYASYKDTSEYKLVFGALHNKGRIAEMIAVWPWDLLSKVIDKPIEWTLRLLRRLFDLVSNRVTDGMAAEIRSAETRVANDAK